MPDPTLNPFTVAYRGEELLNDPTLLSTMVDPATPDSLHSLVAAAWEAFLSNPTDDRWIAFSHVLVAADAAHMSTETIIAFGRKWAEKMPYKMAGEEPVFPPAEVITMFGPHLEAAGRLAHPEVYTESIPS